MPWHPLTNPAVWIDGWNVRAHELEPSPTSAARARVDREQSGLDAASRQAVATGFIAGLTPSTILHLQRTIGNAAVQRLLVQRDDDGTDGTTGTGGSDSVPYVFATPIGNSSGTVSLSELRKGTNRRIRAIDGDEFEFNPA